MQPTLENHRRQSILHINAHGQSEQNKFQQTARCGSATPSLQNFVSIFYTLLLFLFIAPSNMVHAAWEDAESTGEGNDVSSLIYGEALYSFYSGDEYSSINRLLTAQKQSLLNKQQEHADLLLGSLYLNYGLPKDADDLFSNLITQEILPKTRARTWFEKARLYYQAGNYIEAEKILVNELTTPVSEEMNQERHIMLANILMAWGQFQAAVDHLAKVSSNTTRGAYAKYNAGVALSHLGDLTNASEILYSVVNIEPDSYETTALKDRAALALGYIYLREGNPEQAKTALQTIRLTGPFSNEALLGLGWADYQLGNVRRAIVPWKELIKRNPTDRSVQEALIALPNAFEEAGALQSALENYRFAVSVFKKEIQRIDTTKNIIANNQWTENLLEVRKNADLELPMAEIPTFRPTAGAETVYLYKLFSKHEFNEVYENFIELQRLSTLLTGWKAQIPIFMNTLEKHESSHTAKLSKFETIISTANSRHGQLEGEFEILGSEMQQAIRKKRKFQMATAKQHNLFQQLVNIESEIAAIKKQLGNDEQALALVDQHRRLKGVLNWDITHNFPKRAKSSMQELQEVEGLLATSALHIKALSQVQKETDARFNGLFYRHFTDLNIRLKDISQEVDKQLEIYKVHMEKQALGVLAQNRIHLNQLLASAHFSMTRLEDAATIQNRGHL